jgi:hypothetical protein
MKDMHIRSVDTDKDSRNVDAELDILSWREDEEEDSPSRTEDTERQAQ